MSQSMAALGGSVAPKSVFLLNPNSATVHDIPQPQTPTADISSQQLPSLPETQGFQSTLQQAQSMLAGMSLQTPPTAHMSGTLSQPLHAGFQSPFAGSAPVAALPNSVPASNPTLGALRGSSAGALPTPATGTPLPPSMPNVLVPTHPNLSHQMWQALLHQQAQLHASGLSSSGSFQSLPTPQPTQQYMANAQASPMSLGPASQPTPAPSMFFQPPQSFVSGGTSGGTQSYVSPMQSQNALSQASRSNSGLSPLSGAVSQNQPMSVAQQHTQQFLQGSAVASPAAQFASPSLLSPHALQAPAFPFDMAQAAHVANYQQFSSVMQFGGNAAQTQPNQQLPVSAFPPQYQQQGVAAAGSMPSALGMPAGAGANVPVAHSSFARYFRFDSLYLCFHI